MPSSRLVPRLAWLKLLLAASGLVVIASCSSSDATTPFQPVADQSWFSARITLLDQVPTCQPFACQPEFLSCDGTVPILFPRTWTMDADIVTAGLSEYNSPATDPLFTNASGRFGLSGTDLTTKVGVTVELSVVLDAAGNVTSAAVLPGPSGGNSSFADVDVECTELNTLLESVSLFGIVLAEPTAAAITSIDTAPPEIEFAVPSGTGFNPAGIVEGTFSFVGQNRQEVGSTYIGRVLVEGCFHVNLPRFERGIPAVASPAACP